MSDDKEWKPDYYVDRLVATARSAALEEAAKVAQYVDEYGKMGPRVAAAIRELKGK